MWKKKQQRNQRYQAKLDKFYQEFKQQLEPLEQEVCFVAEAWIRHLIAFIPRKSIKGAQREALYEWIDEELEIIESNPFSPVNTNELREAFSHALAEQSENEMQGMTFSQEDINRVRDDLEEILGQPVSVSDEELEALARSPDKLQDYIFSLLEERAKNANEESEDPTFSSNDFFTHSQDEDIDDDSYRAKPTDDGALFFDDRRMAKLYRQLAKKLHPDRERDSAKQAEKTRAYAAIVSSEKREGSTCFTPSRSTVFT